MDVQMDFLCDTLRHRAEVQANINEMICIMKNRGIMHDDTKLQQLEFDAFVSTREEFKQANYGTPEYEAVCAKVQPALDHHYANNSHHTAYHKSWVCRDWGRSFRVKPEEMCDNCDGLTFREENLGVLGMSLLDVLELLADWKAAARRSPDRCFESTLEDAFAKYDMDETVCILIKNTLLELGWLSGEGN